MIIGGFGNDFPFAMKSTEILNLQNPEKWDYGPDLSKPLYSHSVIHFQWFFVHSLPPKTGNSVFVSGKFIFWP